MPYKNKADGIRNKRRYYRENKVSILAKVSAWGKRKWAERKLIVLTHYGPKGKLGCCWPGCKVTDSDILTLDHVKDDGAEHRRNENLRGRFYKWIIDNGFPVGFQTLCCNHQWKKEVLRRRRAAE